MTNPRVARVAFGAVTAAILAGCAGAKVLPPAGNTAYGIYHFHESIATAHPPVELEGDVALLPDTVTINIKGDPCVYSTSNRSAIRTISYKCGDIGFTFDRRNPLRENSYGVPTVQYDNHRVCTATGIVSGREVCIRYGNERVEKRMVITGKLHFVAK